MKILEELVERIAPLVIPSAENVGWENIPEDVKPKVCVGLACYATEIHEKIAATPTGLDDKLWAELREDAQAHFDAANGEGAFARLDSYYHG